MQPRARPYREIRLALIAPGKGGEQREETNGESSARLQLSV